MLTTLRIFDLAVIEEISVTFGDGLNLLTGETGAGKSILVDALGLVSGARSDAGLVRAGADRARVEAEFEVGADSPVNGILDECGIPADDGTLLVRRDVSAGGGGRAYINDTACTVSTLRRVAGPVIDLLGQHEHHGLLSRDAQRLLLDRFGGHEAELEAVGAACRHVREARERLEDLESRRGEGARRAERLREEIREIEEASPRPGELDEVDRERRILANAGRIAELVDDSLAALYEGEPSAAALGSRAGRALAELGEIDPALAELADRVESARVEIEDVGQALRDYRAGTDFDPRRLEQLETRRALLESLRLRYGKDEEEVLRHRDEAAEELSTLENLEAEVGDARARVEGAQKAYAVASASLTRARERAASRLGPEVEKSLRVLAFGKATFRVSMEEPGGGAVFGPQGAESVEFLLAPNPGEPERPLRRIASGGELSRVMLALHGVLEAPGRGRVLVFDEVDAGVGGAVADSIGERLSRLAGRHQVLCVTHLPQVAAYADRHYSVSKRVARGRTLAGIARLDPDGRVEELARMLGGREVSGASRRNAAELIRAAGSRRGGVRRGS